MRELLLRDINWAEPMSFMAVVEHLVSEQIQFYSISHKNYFTNNKRCQWWRICAERRARSPTYPPSATSTCWKTRHFSLRSLQMTTQKCRQALTSLSHTKGLIFYLPIGSRPGRRAPPDSDLPLEVLPPCWRGREAGGPAGFRG